MVSIEGRQVLVHEEMGVGILGGVKQKPNACVCERTILVAFVKERGLVQSPLWKQAGGVRQVSVWLSW